MNPMLLFLLMFGLITSSVYSLLGPCYLPNGQNVSSNYACLPSGDSPCCAGGYACLKNGLCQWTSLAGGAPPDSILVRGSCTDQTWKSNLCPNYCVTPNQDTLNAGVYMLKCPSNGVYYCDDGAGSVANNCTKGGFGYSLSADGFSTLTVIGQTSITAGTVDSVTSISIQAIKVTATVTATSSSSASGSSSSAASSDNSHTSAGTSTSTSNGPPATTPPPGLGVNTKAASPPSGSGINTTALGIGLGVGLGVLAAALLAAVWLLKKRSRRVPSPPPLPLAPPASYIPTYNHESVEHNDKFAPLMPPNSPTSSARYSDLPPMYASTEPQLGRRSGYNAFSYPAAHSNEMQGAHPSSTETQGAHTTEMQGAHSAEVQGTEIHEMP